MVWGCRGVHLGLQCQSAGTGCQRARSRPVALLPNRVGSQGLVVWPDLQTAEVEARGQFSSSSMFVRVLLYLALVEGVVLCCRGKDCRIPIVSSSHWVGVAFLKVHAVV